MKCTLFPGLSRSALAAVGALGLLVCPSLPQTLNSNIYTPERREASRLMLSFQDALAAKHWDAALALCSDRLRSEARKARSAEAFFRDTMPVDLMIAQDFGCWSCGSNFFGQFIDLKLDTGSEEPRIQWFWAIYATNGTWVVDYPPRKLDHYVVDRKAAVKARDDKLTRIRKDIEPKLVGIHTRLTPVSARFVVGSPMVFRVDVTNRGQDMVQYRNAGGAHLYPLTVLNAAREPLPIRPKRIQVISQHGELAPGGNVVVEVGVDITLDYDISEPGRYYVQFDGKGLDFGQPVPLEEPGKFGEITGFWPWDFIAVSNRFPSEVVEIEVAKP